MAEEEHIVKLEVLNKKMYWGKTTYKLLPTNGLFLHLTGPFPILPKTLTMIPL
jgi:hypothetical protein